jgi:hypothetical protein
MILTPIYATSTLLLASVATVYFPEHFYHLILPLEILGVILSFAIPIALEETK